MSQFSTVHLLRLLGGDVSKFGKVLYIILLVHIVKASTFWTDVNKFKKPDSDEEEKSSVKPAEVSEEMETKTP